MKGITSIVAGFAAALGAGASAHAEDITIATVNNGDMIIMQKLSPKWEQQTGNKIQWVVLEENVLRQRVTTDIATKGGQYDVVTIGAYETPIWGKAGWLDAVDDFKDYDYDDLLPPVKASLSYGGKLYAAPFYAESSFTMYRKDLFEKAGLKMPEQPTYEQLRTFADKLNDKAGGVYGICLRGKPGWGENMALVGPMVNSFGGQWFNMTWKPELDSQAWQKAISYYVDLMKADGPPGATANGFNENQALFSTGKCAIWIDATSAAGRIYDPKQSQVADKIAFAKAPVAVTPNGSSWMWAWALAIPTSSKKEAVAKDFMRWATSKDYVKLVGESEGWVAAPPGTRKSTYDSPDYQKAAPFASTVLNAILSADPTHPTKDPVPYTGIQFVAIPEFQGLGTTVGQNIAGALAGQDSVQDALKKSETTATATMTKAGYLK
ncbi:sugar ABC transporter substrate-binding protein [Lichenihabitans sp. PAMC28606]|uniref:ABC transporter substrate-binding protein n=1 Tax=Lichenihabitans sp. PAMC28606 TaxID=2880932 RepID=UPI001D0B462A|nr:sugar ABC transporter substrate-binding protein [Lichenihabitans sp. PAMC28606]UDL96275.1 sugar ABC transporter substrate-binding protein [Lichenihabitans sp. PAMC28606]